MLAKQSLGKTNIKVSRLCFGSLTLGPLQAHLSLQEGIDLVRLALESGVNFIDTAEIYDNYPYIAGAIEGRREQPVIATKSYAFTAEQAAASLQKALRMLKRDYIDLFLLHEQESYKTIKGHLPALKYLWKERAQKRIRAVGISCHTVAAVRAAVDFKGIDVIHPLLNMEGIGILDGSADEMLTAIRLAHDRGIGVYTMKPLAGGHLLGDVEDSFSFLLQEKAVDAVAVGMASAAELEYNCRFFAGEKIPPSLKEGAFARSRNLLLEGESCSACGRCVERCSQGALSLVHGKLSIDHKRCLLCGYCGLSCPQFCLRIG